MVDLTRDANGQVRARLLDLVLGRSGTAYAGWLDARPPEFRAQIRSVALDPFRGYANALRDSLSDAVQVSTPSTSSSSAPKSSTRSAAPT